MEVVSPTLEDFTTTARREFDYLATEFGCTETPPENGDPFTIQFCHEFCRVRIVGRSFGFELDVQIERLTYDPTKNPYTGIFPLWAMMRIRNQELYDQRYPKTRGQLNMLVFDASALRQTCMDLLHGDFSIELEIAALLKKNHEDAVRQFHEENARWEHSRATEAANDAFRKKEFAEVVKQLESVQDRLTPSQIKKLEYARKHVPRSWIGG